MALVVVLWVGVLAGLLLVGVRQGASVELAVGHNELGAVQAHWLARAGVEQARATLADDGRADDSPFDLWYHDEAQFRDVELSTGRFSVVAPPDPDASHIDPTLPRYGVTDLAGRLNVNDADRRQLARLPEITDAIVASILDWRDTNHNTRPGGAESNHYSRLDYPYEPRNGPLETVAELRLIKDIDEVVYGGDPEAFDRTLQRGLADWTTIYSYETNLDALGMERVNINSANASTLQSEFQFSADLAEAVVDARRNEFDSLMDLLEVQVSGSGSGDDEEGDTDSGGEQDSVTAIDLDWLGNHLDRLTLSDDERQPARVNVNTASREVLMTLPGVTQVMAERIIAHRDSDAGPFTNVGELRTSGAVDDAVFRQMAERVTVRSQVFEIRAVGESSHGVRQEIVAVVDREASPARIVYWYQSE